MSSVKGTWKLHPHKITNNHWLDTSQNLDITEANNVWTIRFKTTDGTQHAPTQAYSGALAEFSLSPTTETTIKAKLLDTDLIDVIIGIVFKGTLAAGSWSPVSISDADIFLATRTTP